MNEVIEKGKVWRASLLLMGLALTMALAGCPPDIFVTVTPPAATIAVNATVTLQATSTDENDTFSWSTDNAGVATVSAAGVVTGVSAGQANITATGSESGETDRAVITVTAPPAEVTVTPATATIGVAETLQLAATSTDAGDTISWSSSAAGIATVDQNGLVSGVGAGEATITATGSESGATDVAVITVNALVVLSIVERFDDTSDYIDEIPESVIDADTKEELLSLLAEAEDLYRAPATCDAATTLDTYLAEAQTFRATLVAKAQNLGDPEAIVGYGEFVFGLGSQLQYEMIESRGEVCLGHERVGMAPVIELAESDENGTQGSVQFGEAKIWPLLTENLGSENEAFTEMLLPAIDSPSGRPGTPNIPSVIKLLAIPLDSEVSGTATPSKQGKAFRANIYPVQDEPVDQGGELEPPPDEVFANPPFVQDTELYQSDDVFPPDPLRITSLGRFREMELVQVEIFGGEYNPMSDEMTLYEDVAFDIDFEGGDDGFLTAPMRHVFESNLELYAGSVVNAEAVLQARVIDPGIFQLIGEELIILTHPDFREAADALAVWKNQKGIVTHVFEGGTGSGVTGRQTREEIDAFLENRYLNSVIKASYVLLLGDAEFISPFYRDGIGTDWPYAAFGAALCPTFAVGRIPVDTLTQANVVVNKIIAYEKTPPGGIFNDPFYRNALLASQFQCCRTDVAQVGTSQRTFAQVSEFARNVLVGQGKTVQRIYQETVDGDYGGDPTPRRYYDGTPVPAAIGPGSGFDWNGTRAQVISAFNAGRFLIMHRDHGWHGGWAHPPFDKNDAAALTNGSFLPVVFSINCSSGLFDNETAPGAEGSIAGGVYFAEHLLRNPDGGAVGVIGDTRVSPSWPNSALARGLFDAIWPSALPAFGANVSHRRLGDILNHAKLYLCTQIGVAGQGVSADSFQKETYLYHVLGDPTLEIWTKDPKAITLPLEFVLAEIQPPGGINVQYPFEGAEVTAFQETRGQILPVGRAIVQDGLAEIEYFEEPNVQQPILLAATADDAVSVQGEVEIPIPQ